MSKNLDQLTAVTSSTTGDKYHLFRSGVDYKIDFDDLKSSINLNTINSIKVVIASTDVLTSNGTPVLCIPAPPAGYAIRLGECSISLEFNTIAYATNLDVQLFTDTATIMSKDVRVLDATASTHRIFHNTTTTGGATDTELIESKGIYFKTKTGNPTAGDSDITLYIDYRLVAL